MAAGGGRDPYDARREAGRASRTQTRQRPLASADALFRAKGYAATATPLDAQAWHAAVHQAVRREASVQAAGATCEQERASAYLRGLATVFAAVAQRTADYWRINQGAGRQQPRPRPVLAAAPERPALHHWTRWCVACPLQVATLATDAPAGSPGEIQPLS